MKFTIDWHKTGAANTSKSIIMEEQKLSQMYDSLCESRRKYFFYMAQIKEAENRGLDGFDSERFMIKRKPKQQPDPSAMPPGETP